MAENNLCAPKAKEYGSIEEAKKDIERLSVLVLIKLLKYSYKVQWKDIMPLLLSSLFKGGDDLRCSTDSSDSLVNFANSGVS